MNQILFIFLTIAFVIAGSNNSNLFSLYLLMWESANTKWEYQILAGQPYKIPATTDSDQVVDARLCSSSPCILALPPSNIHLALLPSESSGTIPTSQKSPVL